MERLGAAFTRGAAALLWTSMALLGCSADDEGKRNGVGSGADASAEGPGKDGSIDDGRSDGGGGVGGGGAGGAGGDGMDAGDDPLDDDNACGTGEAAAELTPVNMFVMFDRSGSMNDDDKWPNATAALSAFFQNPASADLGVALRFFPHNSPATGCSNGSDNCDPVACSQPLVDISTLSADPAPTDAHEAALIGAIMNSAPGGGMGGGTPLHPALDGALRWAGAHAATTPDEKTVVILVTDGEPNGCDEDIANIAALAAAELAASGVTTYAIGLAGSSEDQMNQIAAAGGTTSGIFIDNSATAEQELLAALNAIRGQTLSCDFPMPTPSDSSMEVDPTRINVTYTPSNGSAVTFRQVPASGDCGASSAWYYDDPSAPTRIFLCPMACDTVRDDPNPQLKILIGCATCGGLDVDCDEGTPPDVPPIIID